MSERNKKDIVAKLHEDALARLVESVDRLLELVTVTEPESELEKYVATTVANLCGTIKARTSMNGAPVVPVLNDLALAIVGLDNEALTTQLAVVAANWEYVKPAGTGIALQPTTPAPPLEDTSDNTQERSTTAPSVFAQPYGQGHKGSQNLDIELYKNVMTLNMTLPIPVSTECENLARLRHAAYVHLSCATSDLIGTRTPRTLDDCTDAYEAYKVVMAAKELDARTVTRVVEILEDKPSSYVMTKELVAVHVACHGPALRKLQECMSTDGMAMVRSMQALLQDADNILGSLKEPIADAVTSLNKLAVQLQTESA